MGLIRDRQTAQGDAKTQLEGFLPGNAVRIPTNWGGRNHVLFFWNQKISREKKRKLWGNAAYYSMNGQLMVLFFGMEGLYQLK